MKMATALKLGRVSNLPTVWTNVLVGCALVNPGFEWPALLTGAAAISLLYLSGMFLNDVFDLEWDRRHRSDRPLVAGEAGVSEVTWISIMFLVGSLALLWFASGEQRMEPTLLSAVGLIGLILLYDWKHKTWSISPWVMGGCRLMVYLTAAAMVAAWNWQVLIAGLCLLGYIAGITYVARTEHLNTLTGYRAIILLFLPAGFALYLGFDQLWSWLFALALLICLGSAIIRLLPGERRQIAKAVGALLAAITLIDATILIGVQQYSLALLAVMAYGLCLLLQRRIAAS